MMFKTFEYDRLSLHFLGDEEILLDMITAFEAGHERLLEGIAEAIDKSDSNELRIRAHTFKGIMSSFFATHAREICLDLEELGKGPGVHKNSIAQEHYLKLVEHIDELIDELRVLKIKLNVA